MSLDYETTIERLRAPHLLIVSKRPDCSVKILTSSNIERKSQVSQRRTPALYKYLRDLESPRGLSTVSLFFFLSLSILSFP